MIAIARPSLLARWRRQLGRHARRNALPRPLAALGYMSNGAVVDGLVEIENLILVVLYDEMQDSGRLSVTVGGYSGSRIPWGAQWGGPEHSLFLKNLLLRPRPQARGRCLDASRTQLLELSLQLDRQVDRYTRYLRLPKRRAFVLPRLWAGFKACQLAGVTADGPELMSAAQRSGQSPEELLQLARRDYEGLALLPLEWTSHCWERMTAVFADLCDFPRRQVAPLENLPDDLQGFQAATQFDFYNSRFRTVSRDVRPTTRSAVPVAV